ncbi:MAG: transposase, partial [Pseudorhodobacter sp.]
MLLDETYPRNFPLPDAVIACLRGRLCWPDNVVRFIEAFVDSLDLAAAGFDRAVPKTTGRPGYDPSDLLKLYIYGYLNRVRSSRRLESETHRNL